MSMVRRAGMVGLVGLAAVGVTWAQDAGVGREQSLLSVIWQGMEWPAWFILAGSIVVITLIVEHFLTVRPSTIIPPAQLRMTRELIERRQFRECLDRLRKSATFFASVMTAALEHARHGFEAMHAAAIEKSGEVSGRMFRKVEHMNILGNLGPLMGLLGTVWGMIIAFGALGEGGGEASAGDLARGISLALVNTLLGLMLAIVGLGFFGVCRNRIDALTVHATVEVLNLLEYFRPAAAARPPEIERIGEAPRVARAEPARPAVATGPVAKPPAQP